VARALLLIGMSCGLATGRGASAAEVTTRTTGSRSSYHP
jgi:hypothetical protein